MKLLIAGGGTGGHVFPALAVAEELKSRDANHEVLFVGTETGFEAKIIPQKNFPLKTIPRTPLVGLSLKDKIKSLSKLRGAVSASKKIIEEFKPDAILGVGGYASAPAVYAGYKKKKKTFLLEQNAVPGITNRILSYIADYVFVSFESTKNYFPKQDCELTGNPVRKEFLNVASQKIAKKREDPFCLFIMGGSQGAHIINITVIETLPLFKELPHKLKIIHQTGKEDFEMVKKEYAEKGVSAEIFTFAPDMAEYLKRASLVVGRAGAGTVSELIVTQTPSILIPYTYAKSHQIYNAKELEKKGAARIVAQQDLSEEKLFNIIKQMMTYPQALEKMKEALVGFHWGNPAEKVVNFIMSQMN